MIPDTEIVIPTCFTCGEEMYAVMCWAWPFDASVWVCPGHNTLIEGHCQETPSLDELQLMMTLAQRALDR